MLKKNIFFVLTVSHVCPNIPWNCSSFIKFIGFLQELFIMNLHSWFHNPNVVGYLCPFCKNCYFSFPNISAAKYYPQAEWMLSTTFENLNWGTVTHLVGKILMWDKYWNIIFWFYIKLLISMNKNGEPGQ